MAAIHVASPDVEEVGQDERASGTGSARRRRRSAGGSNGEGARRVGGGAGEPWQRQRPGLARSGGGGTQEERVARSARSVSCLSPFRRSQLGIDRGNCGIESVQ